MSEEKDLDHKNPWRMLVVDDDPGIHAITKAVLNDLEYEGRKLELVHAQTDEESYTILETDQDFAIIITDIVRAQDDSGFRMIEYIRSDPRFDACFLMIRSGSFGNEPWRKVVLDYPIDAAWDKSGLTAFYLFSQIISALRVHKQRVAYKSNSENPLKDNKLLAEELATFLHDQIGNVGMVRGLVAALNETLDDLDLENPEESISMIRQAGDMLSVQGEKAWKRVQGLRDLLIPLFYDSRHSVGE